MPSAPSVPFFHYSRCCCCCSFCLCPSRVARNFSRWWTEFRSQSTFLRHFQLLGPWIEKLRFYCIDPRPRRLFKCLFTIGDSEELLATTGTGGGGGPNYSVNISKGINEPKLHSIYWDNNLGKLCGESSLHGGCPISIVGFSLKTSSGNSCKSIQSQFVKKKKYKETQIQLLRMFR